MSQVERLQSLLERVQRNRTLPRGAPALDVAVAPVAVPMEGLTPLPTPSDGTGIDVGGLAAAPYSEQEPDQATVASRSTPSAAPTLREPVASGRSRPAAPSELPFEGDLNGGASPPATRPIARPAPPAGAGAPRPPTRPPSRRPIGPESIDVPIPDAPQRPVVQVTNPPPRFAEPTFGELLERSLALRPR